MYKNLSASFWNSDIWLPSNVTWDDIQSNGTVKYPDFNDLYFSMPLAFLFLAVRFLVERFVWAPLGRSFGLKSTKPKRMAHNELLEDGYTKSRRVSPQQVRQFAEELDWTERRVDRWLRLRRQQDAPDKLTRFTEIGWQFTYYLGIFCYGLHTLWDKQWFWDIRLCFRGLPFHPLDDDVRWYYLLSLGFYWSMTLRHFFDVKHKDFWQMLLHHFITIILLSLSWATNFVRVGTLVLIVHDVSDIFLHGAKVLKYLCLQAACHVTFAAFVVSWIVTRLVVYPGWILYSMVLLDEPPTCALFPIRGLPILSPGKRSAAELGADAAGLASYPAYYVFIVLLTGLLVLHCVWTHYILVIARRALRTGRVPGDARSELSSEQNSEHEQPAKQRTETETRAATKSASGDRTEKHQDSKQKSE